MYVVLYDEGHGRASIFCSRVVSILFGDENSARKWVNERVEDYDIGFGEWVSEFDCAYRDYYGDGSYYRYSVWPVNER
jgi:hypothetical protein